MITTLVVAPMAREAAALGRDAFTSGAGDRAAENVAARLRSAPVDLVIIAGVCGGLDPSLAAGSLVLGRRAIAVGKPELIPDRAIFDAAKDALHARRVPFVQSLLLTVERPSASRVEKTDLWNTYGAAGIDMETYGIASAAEAAAGALGGTGARWLAVRAVVDTASSSLPASLRDWSDDTRDSDVIREALRHPGEWPAYVALAIGMRRALRALSRAVPVIAAAAANAAETAPRGGTEIALTAIH